jgi:putative ABC transport system permease protein
MANCSLAILTSVSTMKEMRDHNVAPDRLNLLLLGGFAVLALVLAIIGLYGLLSFTVTQVIRPCARN